MYKLFEFCEKKFISFGNINNEKMRARMVCCTNSCPYSGALSGSAASRLGQNLLSTCINRKYSASLCCSPCACNIGPGANKTNKSLYKIKSYKGFNSVLFELIPKDGKVETGNNLNKM